MVAQRLPVGCHMNIFPSLQRHLRVAVSASATALLFTQTPSPSVAQEHLPPLPALESANATGVSRTITTLPSFDMNNPFFHSLGTNGRSCATCHGLTEGLNFTADHAQKLFEETAGLHPIFARVDGSDSPNGDMSTIEARRGNTTLIRTRGLIRVQLTLPQNAEFTIESVDDPYHYANSTRVSAYRRPLPATNLRFLSTVMWDGRELNKSEDVQKALRSQIVDAVLGHFQASSAPSKSVVNQILNFETHLFTTQVEDNEAGRLDESPILAGPERLLRGRSLFLRGGRAPQNSRHDDQPPLPRRAPRRFDVFTFFQPWLDISKVSPTPALLRQDSIARGEKLFTTRPFTISNVPGFTNLRARQQRGARSSFGNGARVGACSSCHNLPSVGSSSAPLLMNTGISDATMRTPDMPLYTLKNKKSGALIQTTDPGAAMKSGKWADIGKFKVPSLRALETHSPYMHNGFSAELLDVINFYDKRFSIGLTETEKSDLTAFLEAL
jgi:cytochrome c peroxidase